MTEKQTGNSEGMKFRPSVLVSNVENLGCALMDEAQMEGLVMQKCSRHDIFYSNAFMVATMKESEEPTDKYYKIQDKVFFNVFSKICRDDRFCKEKQCWRNDALAAEFIMEQVIEDKAEYRGITDIKTIESPDKKRKGIHYICPLTKLDEIAIPVRLYDRPMGVLIVGQISIEPNRAMLQKRIEEAVLNTKPKYDGESVEKIIESIKVEKNLDGLIGKIFTTVEDIEQGLTEYYVERQSRFVLEKGNQLIEHLKEAVDRIKVPENATINMFPARAHIEHYSNVGQCIRKQLEELCNIIGVSDKVIFTPTDKNLVANNYEIIEYDKYDFDFGRWKEENGCIYSEDLSTIRNMKSEYDLLVVAPAATYPIALAVMSAEFLKDVSETERELLKKTFCETFSKFAEYAQMVGMETKSDYYRVYLDNYMGIQRHELGQSNAGYRTLIEEFKKDQFYFLKSINSKLVEPSSSDLIEEYMRKIRQFIDNSESYLYATIIRIHCYR